MTGQPVVLRQRARRDVDQAFEHYLTEAGAPVALAFSDALEDVRRKIAERPGSGSTRIGHELGMPELRYLSTGRFPYLVFFVERAHEVDVWRVLHGARDLPASLRDPDER